MHEIRDFCVRTNRRKVKTCQQGKTLQRMRLAYMCTVTVIVVLAASSAFVVCGKRQKL